MQRTRCRGAHLRGGPGGQFSPLNGQAFVCALPELRPTRRKRRRNGIGGHAVLQLDAAKLIARDKTRDAALDLLDAALGETAIFGVTTNQDFLRRLIALPETRTADFYTRLIDDRLGELIGATAAPPTEAFALAACHWLMAKREAASGNLWHWRAMTGWHVGSGDEGLSPIPILHLEAQGATAKIRFSPQRADSTMVIAVNEQLVTVGLERLGGEDYLAIFSGRRKRCGFNRTVRSSTFTGAGERMHFGPFPTLPT